MAEEKQGEEMEHTDKNIPTIEASPNNNKTISKHTENKKNK